MSTKKYKTIIGIDPGSRVTGYGIIKVSGSDYTAIDYGCIRPPAKMKLSDRYHAISTALGEILEIHRPHALAVETQFVAKNVQSTLKLGMARGVVIVAAKQRQIPVYEYAPSTAKKAVVGRGNASKFQVQSMVQMLLRLDLIPQPDDAADALALAICHAHWLCYSNPSDMEI